jgi:hypothetical protein
MAKELGQIHSINQSFTVNVPQAAPVVAGEIDIPFELSSQLQRTIRQGCMYKIVGIDMTVSESGATGGGGQINGFLRYYAPTKGRCEAYRAAFDAMRKQMQIQGISMRDNPLYDFRVGFNDETTGFRNQAALDGVSGLCFSKVADARASVFGVHNESVKPQYTGAAGDLFKAGFDTLLSKAPAEVDFVLNDTVMYTGNHDAASTDFETIPFQLSYAPGSTDVSVSLQWRPDPALYLAVMGGLFQVYIDEADGDSGATALRLEVNVMVSGWKSIMGQPDKKKTTRRSRA